MRNHVNLGKRIHVIANLTADCFTNILHIIETFSNTIVIYIEEKANHQSHWQKHLRSSASSWVSFLQA